MAKINAIGNSEFPTVYLNYGNFQSVIYLEPEKSTPFGRSLPVLAIIGKTTCRATPDAPGFSRGSRATDGNKIYQKE